MKELDTRINGLERVEMKYGLEIQLEKIVLLKLFRNGRKNKSVKTVMKGSTCNFNGEK